MKQSKIQVEEFRMFSGIIYGLISFALLSYVVGFVFRR
jgi:hypothetical protein